MRLTIVLSLCLVVQCLGLQSYSQETTLNLTLKNVSVKKVLQEIEDRSEFYFLYNDDLVDVSRIVDIEVRDSKIQKVLSQLFRDDEVNYIIRNRQIILSPLEKEGNNLLRTGQGPVTIRGRVISSTKEPIPGVTILIKGTSVGTITDAAGNYTISNVPRDAVLVFSFVGMKPQEVEVGNQTNIQVVMQEETVGIEEVVVTALGIEKTKKSLTYATQQVNMESLTTTREANLGNLLAGKVAGLTVTTSSGSTGVSGAARIILRGDRSINFNNQPLIVIDGIPTAETGAGLSGINPDDVDNINVLKGPAAAALYGSSAQNGVIVITTKKGKMGKSAFEVNSVVTFDLPYLYPELQNEYAQGLNGSFNPSSDVSSWGPKMTGQTVTDWTGKQVKLEPQPNNMKDFFRTGKTYMNTFSYSTGVARANVYMSYGNTVSRGLLETNNMQRHNFNLRVSSEIVKNLHADLKVTYFNQKIKDDIDTGIGQFSAMYQLCMMPRSLRTSDLKNYSYYDEDISLRQNTWAVGSTSVNNPYWAMYANERPSALHRINAFASVKYNFTDWLSLQARSGLNVQYSDSQARTWWDTVYIFSGKGDYQTAMSKNQTFIGDALLVFRKQVKKDFNVSVSLGAEIKDVFARSLASSAGGLTMENKFALAYAQKLTVSEGESHIQKQAVYGVANLNFRDYLFLDVTARNDWSSTLPPPYSYFYPSVGLTGIVSNMVSLPHLFSYLKLRGSYAEVGNDAPWNLRHQTFAAAALGPVGFLSPLSIRVPIDLIPEMTKSWEAGCEIGFFQDRLKLDATWYKSNTYNQLILTLTPSASGYSAGFINCGNIQNKGIEILLSAKPVQSSDFNWSLDLNFARNWNKVIELAKTVTEYEISTGNLSAGSSKAIVGEPYGEIYTKGYERNEEGEIVVDAQGLPKITSTYSHRLGNYNHDFRSGLTNTFSYKNWVVSCLIDLNYGGIRQSITEAHLLLAGTGKESLKGREGGFIFEGVKEDGTPNDIVISAQSYATRVGGRITNGSGEPFTHDATYSRLRELSVGYRVPTRLTGIKSLQVSLVARNLFFLYNACKWFDPDDAYDISVNGFGSESFQLPGTRTLGVNIKMEL